MSVSIFQSLQCKSRLRRHPCTERNLRLICVRSSSPSFLLQTAALSSKRMSGFSAVEKTPPASKLSSDHVKTRILGVPPPVGGTLLPRSPCRLFDQPSHLGRVGKEGHMTRLDLGRLRAHPLRQETLEFRVDGAILCPHDVPARDVLPGRAADRGIKDRSGYRLLGR